MLDSGGTCMGIHCLPVESSEVADHPSEAAAVERRSGMSECKAEKQAVGRFAAPDRLATKFDRFTAPFRLLFLLASLATTGVGLWLLWVIGFVLPTRDPAHIPLWRGVALACFLYSGLCWSYLVLGPRKRLIRWLVFGISVPAVGLGLYGIIHMIRVANGGGISRGTSS
jgi:hypothetical protein